MVWRAHTFYAYILLRDLSCVDELTLATTLPAGSFKLANSLQNVPA